MKYLRCSSTTAYIIVLLHQIITITISSSPSQFKNYNAYNYDLTTPQFTPDGRLLQVEYAHLSTQHCSPLLVIPCKVRIKGEGDEEEEMCIIMATFHKNNRKGKHKNNIRNQSRIISIPINEKNNCIGIGLSGILADNISLLQEVKSQLSSFTKWYGMYSPYSNNGNGGSSIYTSVENVVNRIGDSIAMECQKCSFGGGIRPYGASIVICGIDEDEQVSISITYPSGSVVKMKPQLQKRQQLPLFGAVVIGGTEKAQAQIYRKLNEQLNNEKEVAMTLANMLKQVVSILISDQEDVTKEGVRMNCCGNSLELVVMTKSNGMYRLQESHVATILKSLC